MAKEYGDKVTFSEIDCYGNSSAATNYNITVTPTILVIKDGQIVARIEGVPDEDELRNDIKDIL